MCVSLLTFITTLMHQDAAATVVYGLPGHIVHSNRRANSKEIPAFTILRQ